MNILLDTNILIHLEDNKIIDESFSNLYKICKKNNHSLFIHPASINDINNDKDGERKAITLSKLNKYEILQNAPTPSLDEISNLNLKENSNNDKNDNLILFALYKNSVNILLTEDIGIIKKAKQLGIVNRVLHVQEALHSFSLLYKEHDISYPEMTTKFLYELDKNDDLFDSLKQDYPEFNKWFDKISQERRKCWIHNYHNEVKLSGILIYKSEKTPIVTNDNRALNGKVLKISTFKIASKMQGFKLGELFIKTTFNYAIANKYEFIYLTVRKDKQEFLVNLLEDFGFYYFGICDKNRDDVYVKEMPIDRNMKVSLRGLDLYKKYSTLVSCDDKVHKFIVPIQPKFHNVLFPELEDTRRLLYINSTVGNTIKKAYLSHANTNEMQSGDLLLFYRSKDKMAITTLGIVEKVFKSMDTDNIIGEVAKRTVYSHDDISTMALKHTHVILFRLVNHFEKPYITKRWMEEENIYKNCQSICKINDDTFTKIMNKSNFNYCIDKGNEL